MATSDTPMILGQAVPNGVLTDLYTVPASNNAVVSSIVVCNQNASAATFTITAAVGGAVDAAKQQLFSGPSLNANDTFIATIGATLAAGDKIRVNSPSNNVSFTAFGSQIA